MAYSKHSPDTAQAAQTVIARIVAVGRVEDLGFEAPARGVTLPGKQVGAEAAMLVHDHPDRVRAC